MFGKPSILGKPSLRKAPTKSHDTKNIDSSADSEKNKRSPSEPASDIPKDSLNDGKSTSEPIIGNAPRSGSKFAIDTENEQKKIGTNTIDPDLVRDRYTAWIEKVKVHTPNFVSLSLLKTKVLYCENTSVVIECQDALVQQLVSEHEQVLTQCLCEVVETNINIKTVIRKQDNTTASNDPYARLKQLQLEKPIVKSIVELLGAELEY